MRLCAKSREAISSSVDFLTLHKLVRQLKGNEWGQLHKLMKLKDELGEIANKDENRLKKLKRLAEE